MLRSLIAGFVVVALTSGLGWRWGRRAVDRVADERARLLVTTLGEALVLPEDAGAADQAVQRLGTAMGADAAALGLVTGKRLRLFGTWGYVRGTTPRELAPGEGESGRAWETGRAHVVTDTRASAAYRAGNPKVRSGIYVPGHIDGRVILVLCVESARVGAFTERDIAWVEPIADVLAALVVSRRAMREAATREDQLLPLVGAQVAPPLQEAQDEIALLTRHGSRQERADHVLRALSHARRLERLVDGVLLAARVGAGDVTLHRDPFPLRKAAAAAVAGVDPAPAVAMDVDAGLTVVGDETHLVLALRGLLAAGTEPAGPAPMLIAQQVGAEVGVEVTVAHADPLRRHVAERLVAGMGGRVELLSPSVLVLWLPAAAHVDQPRAAS